MPRSRNNVASKAKKKKIFKLAKGYFGRRKNVWTVAKNAVEKALQYSYIHRKTKKREIRSLWIQRINAAVRLSDMSYSDFMDKLKKAKIDLNRKVLADIAMNDPESFKQIVKSVS
ncbi:MAG: 50S ribosomal protein L20 [Flammeovirgaceae bacterium]|nr:50S ribosomal protein L20 [Flammeovirgaceae bacterium]|tara:strand:- start:311 stop:655 length:345 start_codon:yes stop_codon:yes gene_type:complete